MRVGLGLEAGFERLRVAMAANSRDPLGFVRRISGYTDRGAHTDVALLHVVSTLLNLPFILLDATGLEDPSRWALQQFIAPHLVDRPWVVGQPLSDRHQLIVFCDDHYEPVLPADHALRLFQRPRADEMVRTALRLFTEPTAPAEWQETCYLSADGGQVVEMLRTPEAREVLRLNRELPPPVIRALLANAYQLSWNGTAPSGRGSNGNEPNRCLQDMYFVRPVDLARPLHDDYVHKEVRQYYGSTEVDSVCVLMPCMLQHVGGAVEVITVVMRAKRFIIYHASDDLPQHVKHDLEGVRRTWIDHVMQHFWRGDYDNTSTSRRRKNILDELRSELRRSAPPLTTISVPDLTTSPLISVRSMALWYWAVESVRGTGEVELPQDVSRMVRCLCVAWVLSLPHAITLSNVS